MKMTKCFQMRFEPLCIVLYTNRSEITSHTEVITTSVDITERETANTDVACSAAAKIVNTFHNRTSLSG